MITMPGRGARAVLQGKRRERGWGTTEVEEDLRDRIVRAEGLESGANGERLVEEDEALGMRGLCDQGSPTLPLQATLPPLQMPPAAGVGRQRRKVFLLLTPPLAALSTGY